jgi:ABC-2 type transport system ATP-binding protein
MEPARTGGRKGLRMHAVATRGLSHRFSNDTVLRQIDLEVAAGTIYGFLGPNGAGKTTTLRLILGLLRQQEGTIHVFGQPLRQHRIEILRRVGSSIESPSLYGHLTARENLDIWRTVFRCPARRIDEVLRLVGLSDTGRKRADQFSLGMKQRLSIAVALLHEPALLILDEPTNGLDPHGILEVRDLLGRLNREHGMTVLVSSHILSEIEKLVTHVGIIHRGAMMFQGTLAALVARQEESSFTAIDTSDNARAAAIVTAGGWGARLHGGKVLVRPLPAAEVARIVAALVAAGVGVHEVATIRKDLETIFLELIGA